MASEIFREESNIYRRVSNSNTISVKSNQGNAVYVFRSLKNEPIITKLFHYLSNDLEKGFPSKFKCNSAFRTSIRKYFRWADNCPFFCRIEGGKVKLYHVFPAKRLCILKSGASWEPWGCFVGFSGMKLSVSDHCLFVFIIFYKQNKKFSKKKNSC